MGGSSRQQPWRGSSKPQASEVLYRVEITFEDNRKLANVLGEFDAHLAHLENRLGIKAIVHGNVVVLDGDKGPCLHGKLVLETLYQRGSGDPLNERGRRGCH